MEKHSTPQLCLCIAETTHSFSTIKCAILLRSMHFSLSSFATTEICQSVRTMARQVALHLHAGPCTEHYRQRHRASHARAAGAVPFCRRPPSPTCLPASPTLGNLFSSACASWSCPRAHSVAARGARAWTTSG